MQQKYVQLKASLQELGSVLVAYSGGTDSAFLAYTAHRTLGEHMLAVIADSPSLPRRELADAVSFARQHAIPLEVLCTNELSNPNYVRNDAQRCFHCKDELFTQMERKRAELGFAHLAFGMNTDDQGEFRPGQRAAALHHAKAPLLTAGLSKAEIRALAREHSLVLADKPASACLSSRVEYGRPVDATTLRQIEVAEEALHALGLPQVRVRHHGEVARIEIARTDLPRVLDLAFLDRITTAVKASGFRYVALDTQGYRSGSMNDVLPVSALMASSTH